MNKDIFNAENTYWETFTDDEGHIEKHLVYGDMSDLAEETGLSEEELEEKLREYEELSKEEM